jgi:hypothetical protein
MEDNAMDILSNKDFLNTIMNLGGGIVIALSMMVVAFLLFKVALKYHFTNIKDMQDAHKAERSEWREAIKDGQAELTEAIKEGQKEVAESLNHFGKSVQEAMVQNQVISQLLMSKQQLNKRN